MKDHDDERASQRRRGRRLMLLVYPPLYLLTFWGIGRDEPRLWGIPFWYLWAGLLTLALVPLNLYFVRHLWPEEKGSQEKAQEKAELKARENMGA